MEGDNAGKVDTEVVQEEFDLFGDVDFEEAERIEEERLEERRRRLERLSGKSRRDLTCDEARILYLDRFGEALKRMEDGLTEETRVHEILRVFTEEECRGIVEEVERMNAWTGDRHSSYPTVDVPVERLESREFIRERIEEVVLQRMEIVYQVPIKLRDLRDFFIVKYHEDGQRELRLHTDGSLFSFTIPLSRRVEYEGGGTYFPHLKSLGLPSVLIVNQGTCLFHSGKLLHAGQAVTRGCRIVLVGFVDVGNRLPRRKEDFVPRY